MKITEQQAANLRKVYGDDLGLAFLFDRKPVDFLYHAGLFLQEPAPAGLLVEGIMPWVHTRNGQKVLKFLGITKKDEVRKFTDVNRIFSQRTLPPEYAPKDAFDKFLKLNKFEKVGEIDAQIGNRSEAFGSGSGNNICGIYHLYESPEGMRCVINFQNPPYQGYDGLNCLADKNLILDGIWVSNKTVVESRGFTNPKEAVTKVCSLDGEFLFHRRSA